MSTKACTSCKVELPLSAFASRGKGRKKSACRLCTKDRRQELNPSDPKPADPTVLVLLNNLACIWFGPVNREAPLRWTA